MKLTAKQLNALPDSEFGLVKNGKRSYPLTDKNHVRSAIAFFKYAKPEDRAELAKNINRKAKEFNMKIKSGGLFVRYIDPKVSSYDKSATYITDASHIGTLAPIVGAINTNSEHKEEAKQIVDFMNNADFFDKEKEIVKESMFDTETFGGSYTYLINTKNKTKQSEFYDFDELIRRHVVNYEIEEYRKYMLCNINDSYQCEKDICDCSTTKVLHEILDSDKNTQTIIDEICALMLSKKDKNRILACLSIIYFRRPNIVNNIIYKLFKMNSYFGETFADNIFYRKLPRNILKKTQGLTADEIAFFDHLTSYDDKICLLEFYLDNAFLKKYNICNENGNVNSSVNMMMIDKLYKEFKITGYYSLEDPANLKIKKSKLFFFKNKHNDYYIGKFYTKPIPIFTDIRIGNEIDMKSTIPENIFRIYLELKNKGTADIKYFELCLDKDWKLQTNVMESSLIEKTMNKTKKFMKGIHVDNEGNVKFNLTDKLSFDHYEEIHKMIKTSYDSGNIEETKRLLAYIFSIILTIEREYMNEGKGTNKKYINKQDPTYKEMIRLRALYISDFKVYMRKIVTKDPKFKFLDYYSNSEVNQSVYTVNANDIKKIALAFRMAMV